MKKIRIYIEIITPEILERGWIGGLFRTELRGFMGIRIRKLKVRSKIEDYTE